jgi:hypothetical protein
MASSQLPTLRRRHASRTPLSAILAAVALGVLLAPAGAGAATSVFGSPLSGSATLNTAENLAYEGVNTEVPVGPEAPNGVIHTSHFGADTVLWSTAKQALAPEGGQVLKIRLEGCAKAAAGGPEPLREIHFQALTPLPGGGERVDLSSQGFEMPVCGAGASSSTVSTYEPVNLCVNRGDNVALNDEGGFVERFYRSGVPYEVLAANRGATTDSFIRNEGTMNGAVLEPSYVTAMEGFAASANEELMMQMELGTGPDARYVCPGGTKDAPPVLPMIHIHPQTDGVNHARIVEVAIYCRPTSGCPGTATLTTSGTGRSAGRENDRASFDLAGATTSRVAVRISSHLIAQIRKHGGAAATFTAAVGGQTFSQTVEIKIL